MQELSCQDIRNKWIEFFTKKCGKEHLYFKSASLVPQNPTLLLTAAGMVQFIPYFLGLKDAPKPPRAVSIQKCARVGGKDSDLENIGRTTRHHSFFEMLGNFSIGDYFKQDAISWAWKFVTEELELPKEKLFVSVFKGDEQNPFDQEAYDIWHKLLTEDAKQNSWNFDAEQMIKKFDRKDNFWGPPGPTGPCGPCSEIYYDAGAHIEDPEDRYVEIWNLVFMEFEKDEEGKFHPLAKKNIDTGAGLERIATILQNKANSFETDELFAVLENLTLALNEDLKSNSRAGDLKYSGVKASSQEEKDVDLYLKIITDHLRCLTFLIADGVRPSNLGRGYVLRMITRRAARFVYLLRQDAGAFLYKMIPVVVKAYSEAYPELLEAEKQIVDICKKEEEQFAKTIVKGMALLDEKLKKDYPGLIDASSSEKPSRKLDGAFVFDLYSTYGFPIELTRDVVEGYSIEIDEETYEKAKEKHSEASSTEAFSVSVLQNKELPKILKEHGETKFLGYEDLSCNAKVLALLDSEGQRADEISLNDYLNTNDSSSKDDKAKVKTFSVVLDQTTFYAESGGQVGDQGILELKEGALQVVDTKKVEGLFVHEVCAVKKQDSALIKVGEELVAKVDAEHRRLTKSHHTACHLLQAALRKVLGDQVQQAGSQVGPEYTRFDFNFDRKMSKEEIAETESIINKWIQDEISVNPESMTMDEALKKGALAFFEEKYGDKVRVLFIGDDKEMASVELCGGIHVANTKDIVVAKIASEASVAAGIRRIKMFTNDVANKFIKENEALEAEKKAKKEAEEKAKKEAKEKKKLMAQKALTMVDSLANEAEDFSGSKAIVKSVEGLDGESLKTLAEALKDKLSSLHGAAVVFLATEANSKVVLVAAVSDDLSKTINAGALVKEAAVICGGGGGGRPNFAQAGGKDPAKIPDAINAVKANIQALACA